MISKEEKDLFLRAFGAIAPRKNSFIQPFWKRNGHPRFSVAPGQKPVREVWCMLPDWLTTTTTCPPLRGLQGREERMALITQRALGNPQRHELLALVHHLTQNWAGVQGCRG